jgi:Flp pilus assembly protein TadB
MSSYPVSTPKPSDPWKSVTPTTNQATSLTGDDAWVVRAFVIAWFTLLLCFTVVIICLPKTAFLLAYLLACATVIAMLYVRRIVAEPVRELTKFDTSDPYRLAYLRGGANEALRVATAVLIEARHLRLLQNESSEKKGKAARDRAGL